MSFINRETTNQLFKKVFSTIILVNLNNWLTVTNQEHEK